jgi:serine/threonine protein kinase
MEEFKLEDDSPEGEEEF